MDDLIKRSEAIDAIRQWVKMHQYYHPHSNGKTIPVDEAIDELERVQAEQPSAQQWIPVSERLPNPNERIGLVNRYYLVQNEYGDMMVASYKSNTSGECWWEQIYCYFAIQDEVVAWMPLPERYRGKND